jgi:hypothetical protein
MSWRVSFVAPMARFRDIVLFEGEKGIKGLYRTVGGIVEVKKDSVGVLCVWSMGLLENF